MTATLTLVAITIILIVAIVTGTLFTAPRSDEDPFSEEFYRNDD